MTIHNLEKFVENLWDWGFLDKCFAGTKIRMTDLDGIVERNGEFLVIEAKSMGKLIPRGQFFMYERLASKGFTILIIWGPANATVQMQAWYPNRPAPEAVTAARNDEVADFVSRWFIWANERGDSHERVVATPRGGA